MRIGVDLGGSHIGVGLIEENKVIGEIKDKILTRQDRVNIEESIINEIVRMVNELLEENNINLQDIELLGIASPGTIANGCIVKAGNLGIKNFDLARALKEKLNIAVSIRNDGKCAALAEKKYGAMKNYDDCVFINIGTGIGGAVFMNGKLLEPKRYSGFELGHMVVNKGGRKCSCGKQGCLEAYASIKALRLKIAETLDIDSDISGQDLREKIIPANREKVEEDIKVYIDYLKTGVCNYIDIFEPQVVCFGGSFSYWNKTDLYKNLLEEINKSDSTFNEAKPDICVAEYNNDAGIIGATIME
jgi:glucokinase